MFVILSSIMFFVSFYYIFSKNRYPEKDEQLFSVEDSYQEYKESVSDTNKGIRSILDDSQLRQINLYEYSLDVRGLEKNENPFVKLF